MQLPQKCLLSEKPSWIRMMDDQNILKPFSQCVCSSKIISFSSAKLLSQTCMTFLIFYTYFAKQSYVIDCFSHKTIKEN